MTSDERALPSCVCDMHLSPVLSQLSLPNAVCPASYTMRSSTLMDIKLASTIRACVLTPKLRQVRHLPPDSAPCCAAHRDA